LPATLEAQASRWIDHLTANRNLTAIFVDGENVSPDYASDIASIGARLGSISVQRVYGNSAILPRWANAQGFRLIHSGTGKNASDLLLVIEAMEIALTLAPANVLIASSDRDFSHLAIRLRERGHVVVGVGEEKAKREFRAAFSEFHALSMKPGPELVPPPQMSLDQAIRGVIARTSKKGRGIPVATLSQLMRKEHNVCISSLPEKKWRTYLSARSKLYDLDPKGPDAHVRFRPAGFAEQ
jgi:hypothetical protein